MNRPVKYAGYTLYQSRYQPGRHGATSVLSVSRDPGLPIVFAGYIVTMVGMVVVLVRRVRQQQRRGGRHLAQAEP